jgi:[1-hydroxy-2-(trimethylamino)ethyl]phosphonate dioxygenase
MNDPIAKIRELFETRGAGEYHGEAVTQLEHALQAATFAEADGCSPALITAALLHDIGHLLHAHGEAAADAGIDDEHEELGARFLVRHFGQVVYEPVRLHVRAKLYLYTTDASYVSMLSPASMKSLMLQGGPMSDEEIAEFHTEPHFAAAVRLRRYDDRAKVPGLATPPFEHFIPILEAARAARV